MTSFKDKKLDMKQLITQCCKQIKGLSQQSFLTVWQAFRKLVFQQFDFDRVILILDSFYLQMIKQHNSKIIKLMPTSTLLAETSMNYRSDDNDLTNMASLITITQGNLYKQVEPKEKQNLEITKQSVYIIYSLIFKHIKGIIKKYKTVNIQLDFLGTIVIYERTFIHQPQTKNLNDKIKVKNLIQRQPIQNYSDLRRQSLLNRSQSSNLLDKSKLNFMNTSKQSDKAYDSNNFQESDSFRNKSKFKKYAQDTQKRPFFHEINHLQSIRICNDLLGAGVDPLTYDYNHSKLVQNREDLVNYKFQKPQKAKQRFPALIDKFSRTIGSQLTGAKVSTSSLIRIGSNYTPSVKNLYIDLIKKQIMRVPQQITIKLEQKLETYPANEEQQYQYFMNKQINKEGSLQLSKRVDLRKKTFQRYRQYCLRHIPNECVAPLTKQSLKNIVDKVKQLVRSLGKKDGKIIFDKLLNEVNQYYYISGKKSIVDYILKDESQKLRTGIHIMFKPASDWGTIKKSTFVDKVKRQNTANKKKQIQHQFLTYPSLILEIVKHNEIMNSVSFTSQDVFNNVRPMNVLYYLKKNSNHLSQLVSFMNQKWIKGAVSIITKNKNWKKQNVKNFKTLLNNVHTLMSNKLKEVIYRSLDYLSKISKTFDETHLCLNVRPILYLHLGEENRKIVFMDDLNNIYRKQVKQLHLNFLKMTSKLISPECYIKQGQERYLWSIDEQDQKLKRFNEETERIIEQNYHQIEKVKNEMKSLQKIFQHKQELIIWSKNFFSIGDLDNKLAELKIIEKEIEEIPFFKKTLCAVIDCHELKKKLFYEVKLMKFYLFETIENLVKRNNQSILNKIKLLSDKISKDIKSTADYVELSKSIHLIKSIELVQISDKIKQNKDTLMKLFSIENCFVNQDLIRQIYASHKSIQVLKVKVQVNQQRILKQRSELQKTLRQRISNFQSSTSMQLRQINMKIDSFQIRKLYQEYLIYLEDYREKSEKNMKQLSTLNHEQQDLKWAVTTFSNAVELQNLISPNYQLWNLVQEYDQSIREWRHIQLCNFEVQKCQGKIMCIDAGISKIINKLKNFSSLKIAHELQNDVKQIINQQLAIIKIFSHPGLKQRHWHLFNKKLVVPGYDLKQITYGRIKILYDYEKNLKVLMSISNQAAKQFEIQNQKNQMHMYWYSLNNQISNDNSDDSMIFVKEDFLNKQISVLQDHLMRTILIKNSPFSKALIQMLTEWENYLNSAKNILIGLKNAQQKFLSIKDIFKIDEISKYLPIQNTQFQSIQNIWKSVIKKVLEQPKISELFKSQKIIQILEQISKKSVYIKGSLTIYLHAKRIEFSRFFFVKDAELITIFSLMSKGNQKLALQKIGTNCFLGVETIQKHQKGYKLRSSIDNIQVSLDKQLGSKRVHKIRIIQDLPLVLQQSKLRIKTEISNLIGMKNLNENQINLNKYTLTSILTVEHIKLSTNLKQIYEQKQKKINQQSQQIQKNLQRFSRQFMDSIKQNTKQLNLREIKKKDLVILRKISSRQIMQNLLHNDINQQQSFQYQLIPKLAYIDNNMNSLVLQLAEKNIPYQFQYLGDSVFSYQFITINTGKIMYQILDNINSNRITLMQNAHSTLSSNILSHLTGKFYKQIQFQDFHQQAGNIGNNIFQLIAGLTYCNCWVNLKFNDSLLTKIALNSLSLVADIIQEKNKRIKQNTDYLMIKQNEVPISKTTGIFFTISQRIFCSIPKRYLSNCRSLSIAYNQDINLMLTNIINSSQLFIDWQSLSKIKIVVQILRNLKSNISISISQLLKDYNNLIKNVCDNENEKHQNIIIMKLLQPYLKEDWQDQLIRKFFKLKSKNLQRDVLFKNQFIVENCQKQQQKLKQQQKQPNEIENYLNEKLSKLSKQIKFHNNILIYGDFGFKTTIIHKCLQYFKLSITQCNQITINTTFLREQNNQIPSLDLLLEKVYKINQKAKTKYIQNINPIIFQGTLNQSKLSLICQKIKQFQKNISCALGFTSFIQCADISNFSPKNLFQLGKVFMNSFNVSDRILFQNWSLKISLKPEQLQYIQSLIPYLQGLLDQICKQKNILTNSNEKSNKRFIFIQNFLRFFQVYLLNLNSKQVEALPQFDAENYIVNSFIFASYWSLCIGFITDQSRKIYQTYIKDTFGCQYDIPHNLDQYFLNEENEWINWESLKEEFSPQKQSQSSFCSIWIPTVQNTKFYTIIIKLIQRDIPILLVGSQAGKSTLLKQISNFQISYNTFIIDCNKKTDIMWVNKVLKEKIIYGDEKRHLILVDDAHLPLQNEQQGLNQLICQMVKRSTIHNLSIYGDINQKIKKSNFIISTKQYYQNDKPALNSASFSKLATKFQTICLKQIDQKEMQCIFRPYINYAFVHNEFDNQILKLQNSLITFIIKVIQAQKYLISNKNCQSYSLQINDVRKLVEGVSRLNSEQFKDKFQIYKHLIFQSYVILLGKIKLIKSESNGKNLGENQNVVSFKKMLQLQHSKFCNPQKNTKQFENLIDHYIYKDLPTFQETNSPLDMNQLKKAMTKYLQIKNQSNIYLTNQHTNMIQKVIHLLKNSPSHFLLINPKQSGSRSLVKMIAHLKNLTYIELGTNTNPEVFVQEIIKILKTGGKIDQCICYIPNEQKKQSQFLRLANSLISSPQFYESFNQIQLEQIIKSFNSEKKILKKDIKRSQIIKKIKQKVNNIFHFFISANRQKYQEIKQTYPNMIRDSFTIVNQQWLKQSIIEVSSKILGQSQKQIKEVTQAFICIYKSFIKSNNKQSELNSDKYVPFLRLFKLYKTFSYHIQKLSQANSQSINLWDKKISQNQAKLCQYKQQKQDFELSNKSCFEQLKELKKLGQEKQNMLELKKKLYKEIQKNYIKIKEAFMVKKTEWFMQSQKFSQRFNSLVDEKFLKHHKIKFKLSDLTLKGITHQLIIIECKKLDSEVYQTQQIIKIIDNMVKNGFSFIKSHNFKKQDIQRQLQNVKNSIQKIFLQILVAQWNQISNFSVQFFYFQDFQQQFSGKEIDYFKSQSQYRELEDQIQQIKQQIEEQTDKNSKMLQSHKDLQNKIQNLESILQILKRLKSTIQTKTDNNQTQYENQITQKQKIGINIMLSVCIKQKIQSIESSKFKTLKQTLFSLGYDLNQKCIFAALNIEQKIQFGYCFDDNNFQAILNYLTIQFSQIYCIAIDKQNQLQKKLKLWTNKQVICLQNQQIEQLKSSLMSPNFIIVKNPSSEFLMQLKPILQYQIDLKISKKFVNTIQDFSIHENAKIIFSYQLKQLIDERVSYNSDWICNFTKNNQSTARICNNFLCKLTSNKNIQQLTSCYIEKMKDLQNLGQKMHSLIVKMKKQNLTVEQIHERINEVNLKKHKMQKEIIYCKKQLKQIFNSDKDLLLKYENMLINLINNYQINLDQILQLLKQLYNKKQKNLQEAFNTLLNITQTIIKPKINVNAKHQELLIIKQQNKVNSHKSKTTLQVDSSKASEEHMKKKLTSEFTKINSNYLLQFMSYVSQNNTLLKTQEPNILKKCLLKFAEKSNINLIQRKITELNSISLVYQAIVLVEIKAQKDWQNLLSIFKSMQDKKLSIKILIICPFDVCTPSQIGNIKQFCIDSVLKFLARIMYENQNQPIQSKRLEAYYQFFTNNSYKTIFQRLSVLQQSIQRDSLEPSKTKKLNY